MFGKIKNNTDEEKYVWVNGFKATDKDLTAAYNNFQYEIDKQYECKGEIVDCKNGFHLSLNLQDVLHYWNLDGRTRFFNVEALVKEKDLLTYGKISFSYGSRCIEDKLVSKKIILVNELKYEDLKEIVNDFLPEIENANDYLSLKNISYKDFCINKFINNMVRAGYSKTFSIALSKTNNYKDLGSLFIKAKGLKEEKVSSDMIAYLLLDK